MAEQLSPKQLNDLGDAYFNGTGKVQNKELAYTYYKQAAEMDNPLGHVNIGKYFIDKGDYKKANEALMKAKSYSLYAGIVAACRHGQKRPRHETQQNQSIQVHPRSLGTGRCRRDSRSRRML
ncbi:MAG: hypothetical protein MZU97_04455 [Bacillus subtilis]|nr:hypothetical protein [Bacillus subtilis]